MHTRRVVLCCVSPEADSSGPQPRGNGSLQEICSLLVSAVPHTVRSIHLWVTTCQITLMMSGCALDHVGSDAGLPAVFERIFNRQCARARARQFMQHTCQSAVCTLPCRSRFSQYATPSGHPVAVQMVSIILNCSSLYAVSPGASGHGTAHRFSQPFCCAHGRDSQQELSRSSAALRPRTRTQRSDRMGSFQSPAQDHLHQVCRISCTIDKRVRAAPGAEYNECYAVVLT
jgi:hypothetical protein